MKKFSVVMVALYLAFVVAPTALAEDSSSSAQTTRTEVRQEIKDLRADNRALIASREAEFKANLQKIKDTRKQTVVSNISDRIANRNTLWVSHWNVVTKRLSTILDKIQARATEASTKGKDITSVTAAISSARTAIASAQSAIDAQSGRTYSIDISTEGNLGQSVKTTLSSFQSEVKSVISLLNTARKAVDAAFVALKTVVGTEAPATTQP